MSATVLKQKLIKDENFTVLFDPQFISRNFAKKDKGNQDENETRIIEGYANVKVIDRIESLIKPPAFEKSIPTYMLNPQLRFNHEDGSSIGKVEEIKTDENGLWIRAKIGNWPLANEKWEQMKFGSLKAFSVMGREKKWEQKKDASGKTFYEITEFDLVEISVVEIPMNHLSLFEIRSAKRLTKNRDKYLEVHTKLKNALIKNYQKRLEHMSTTIETPDATEQVAEKETTKKSIDQDEITSKSDVVDTATERMEGDGGNEDQTSQENPEEDNSEEEDLKTIADFVKSIDEKLSAIEERLSNLEKSVKMEDAPDEQMNNTESEKSFNNEEITSLLSTLLDEKLGNLRSLKSVQEENEAPSLKKSFRKTVSQHKTNVTEETRSLAAAIRERMSQ